MIHLVQIIFVILFLISAAYSKYFYDFPVRIFHFFGYCSFGIFLFIYGLRILGVFSVILSISFLIMENKNE